MTPATFKDFWADAFGNGRRGTYITSNGPRMTFFMGTCAMFGTSGTDFEAGYEAPRAAMPMKISDFTGNMATLMERGELDIAVQNDAEAYLQVERGLPIEVMLWDECKAIPTQAMTISRHSDPVRKRLAYAYLNSKLSPDCQIARAEEFWQRPTNREAVILEKELADLVMGAAYLGTGGGGDPYIGRRAEPGGPASLRQDGRVGGGQELCLAEAGRGMNEHDLAIEPRQQRPAPPQKFRGDALGNHFPRILLPSSPARVLPLGAGLGGAAGAEADIGLGDRA